MKRIVAALSVALFMSGFAHADEASVKKSLLAKFPKLPESAVFVKSLKSEGVDGLYEVTLGNTFGYTDEKVSYVFTRGEVMATKNMENLTTKRAQERVAEGISRLNAEKNAIKTVYGNGKRKIYVFSDPDCPYCKQFERDLAGPNGPKLNATVYTFLYPLPSLHPDAVRKADGIWCAGNNDKRKELWTAVMTKDAQIPAGGAKCKTPVNDNMATGGNLGFNSTPTIVIDSKTVIPGMVPVSRLAEALDELDKTGK